MPGVCGQAVDGPVGWSGWSQQFGEDHEILEIGHGMTDEN
jgi:hypothetical protein